MNLDLFYNNENEKPLEDLANDTGMTAIFRTIACVGDSLSSGEFESRDSEGKPGYHDLYEYSWGQHIARACGNTVYNFSRGGMSAYEYMKSFGEERGFWNPELSCEAYIIALGCNDVGGEGETGSIDDIDFEDHSKNECTFAGHYAKLINKYKEISPDAKFFLVTLPQDTRFPLKKAFNHRDIVLKIAEKFDNTYVINLCDYAPIYDEKFIEKFFLYGHLNPQGYVLTAKMIMAYIDYIIRHNMKDFEGIWRRHVGLA